MNVAREVKRVPTAGDLRAEIGRARMPIYQLAAEVGLHPSRLGQMLNERLPMPLAVAERISEALSRREGAVTG